MPMPVLRDKAKPFREAKANLDSRVLKAHKTVSVGAT